MFETHRRWLRGVALGSLLAVVTSGAPGLAQPAAAAPVAAAAALPVPPSPRCATTAAPAAPKATQAPDPAPLTASRAAARATAAAAYAAPETARRMVPDREYHSAVTNTTTRSFLAANRVLSYRHRRRGVGRVLARAAAARGAGYIWSANSQL
ncbi:hypothetical protein [Amycolatopsis sp. CA-128772]|uniref:hypothetical protein n=1 Tax=Amycolatopsis sp. CA-128772 TaxID=2073159 RepID=UPI0011B0682C|nr:hypothetical protein [Amycolatopsis sp. CA-128772]